MLLRFFHERTVASRRRLTRSACRESNSSICSQLETKSRGGSVARLSARPDSFADRDDDDGKRDGSRVQRASAGVNGRVREGGPVRRRLYNTRTKEAQRRRRQWWRTGGPHRAPSTPPPLQALSSPLPPSQPQQHRTITSSVQTWQPPPAPPLLLRRASMPSACPCSQNALLFPRG